MNFWLSIPVSSENLESNSAACSLGYNPVPSSLMPVSGDLQGDDSWDTPSSFWKKKKIHIIVTMEKKHDEQFHTS